jgi:hypothetical protein
VYVTYFDEVKADPAQGHVSYWVGGISLPMDQIAAIESKMNALSKELFDSTELVEATEFHGKCIYFSKWPFRNWKIEKRLEVFERLLQILTEDGIIKRVYACIDSSKLYNASQAPEFAFAHFCERVEMLMRKGEWTLLIGDMDTHQSKQTIREFSQYRISGTPWAYGIAINSIVDCVHFAHSHHSRMIQLADIYLFAASHYLSGRKGDMAEAFATILKKFDLYPHRFKHWPQ